MRGNDKVNSAVDLLRLLIKLKVIVPEEADVVMRGLYKKGIRHV